MIKHIKIVLLTFIVLAVGCSKKNIKTSSIEMSDCFADRATVATIRNQIGKITMIADIWAISIDNNTRYGACEIPNEYKKEGTTVVFSARVKEIKPTERWAAAPISLLDIDSAK